MRRSAEVVRRWLGIPGLLRETVRGLSGAQLDRRAGPDRMSFRETVHHLVEANLIASNIVIFALARSGAHYDWTWVVPDGGWMERLAYAKAPIGPALATLRALTRHLDGVLAATGDGLERKVQLNDSPGAPRYTKTVAQILGDEVDHAREHLAALPERRARGRSRAGRRRR